MIGLRRGLKYAGLGVLCLVVLVVLGVALGLLGAPTVDGVENRFATVNDSTTTVNTTMAVSNPNPVGVSLGDVQIDYAIDMNDVRMAEGGREGVAIDAGRSTIPFTTQLNNSRIPQWWYTHVDSGEETAVLVDATVSSGLLGGRSLSLPQEQTVETDILGQFNDSTTRPIDADQAVVSDPVLYLNETSATYGANVTPAETPLETAFTVYNPKRYPYAVSEIGYEIEMNGVQVGEGSTAGPGAIPGRSERTLRPTTVIDNQRLDEWWVSHLERDQETTLTIDFYVVIDPDTSGVLGETVEPIRLDVDHFDYETTIETDIFGTKDSDGLGASGAGDGSTDDSTGDEGDSGEETATSTATPTDTGQETTATETATPTPTETATATATETATATPTETATEDDDGLPLDV